MTRALFALVFAILGTWTRADVLVASRIIPAHTIISTEDVRIQGSDGTSAGVDVTAIVGMEARKALFAGRPISLSDVGIPAVVERNQIIELIYQGNGLRIKTDGRVLDRAGPGDAVRVMNLASRSIVTANINENGVGYVSQ